MKNVTQTVDISALELPKFPSHAEPLTGLLSQEIKEPVIRLEVEGSGEETCPQCGKFQADLAKSWCRNCGFYPKLNLVLDLEQYDKDGGAPAATATQANWWLQIPLWVWFTAAGVALLGVESMAAHFLFEEWSGPRTVWSIAQLLVGFCLFATLHVLAYVRGVLTAGSAGMFDILFKPVAVWSATINKLPKTGWQVSLAAQGLAAAFFSIVLIGSIPYSEAFNWGFKPKPKKSLIQQVAAAAGEGNEDLSLEEAMEQMVGATAGIKEEEEKKVQVKPYDCVVIGYTTNNKTPAELTALVLACAHKGELKFAGTVTVGILPSKERMQLLARLQRLQRDYPVVRSSAQATWVNPRLTCRVEAQGIGDSGRLKEPLLTEMLEEIR